MPRSAATIFGLALVAFSIGFNTVRYPIVWDMVGPASERERAVVGATTAGRTRESSASPAATEGRADRRKADARGGQKVGGGETASDHGQAGKWQSSSRPEAGRQR